MTCSPSRTLATAIALVLALAGCSAPGSDADPDPVSAGPVHARESRHLCDDAAPGAMRCHARVLVRPDADSGVPSGFVPSDIVAAYEIPAGGAGVTVAVVDAQDDPNAESDLAVYRAQFNLPACTTANGCFKKVNQSGQASPLPSGDTGWGGEISLDLDMVSAACPACKILLVEGSSASNDDLGAAVNEAAALGATVISNSYGGSESSTDATYDTEYYHHAGVSVLASSGDSGYGAQYPAASQYVIAVGGTSLTQDGSARGFREGAWSDGGSGCSQYDAKPSWQRDTGCSKRTVADVSAVADPNTGVAVYDTYGGGNAGAAGWEVYGGTSASSPLVGAILAASGLAGVDASFVYQNPGSFNDITSGSNGTCNTKSTYLCTAVSGYDGPTGLGTPAGLAVGGGCTPACGGKSCGGDGCGGSCGTCPSGDTCNGSGQCVAGCTPSCSGKSCGGDGCGGSCGTCPSGDTCNGSGQCAASDSCAHSDCTSGAKLKSGCNSCVTKVCNEDSYCCNTKWDSICVSEVGSICGDSCSGGGGGGGSGPPTATNVAVTGSPDAGLTVAGRYTFADPGGLSESGSTYQWRRGGSVIPGATADSYVVAAADIGAALEFCVTPSDGTRSGTAACSATVTGRGPSAAAVAVTGSPFVADTLTGSYTFSDSAGDPESGSTYQWFHDASGTLTAISGATADTYAPTFADLNRQLELCVTPGDANGHGVTVCSAAVAVPGVVWYTGESQTGTAIPLAVTNGACVSLSAAGLTAGEAASLDLYSESPSGNTTIQLYTGAGCTGAAYSRLAGAGTVHAINLDTVGIGANLVSYQVTW